MPPEAGVVLPESSSTSFPKGLKKEETKPAVEPHATPTESGGRSEGERAVEDTEQPIATDSTSRQGLCDYEGIVSSLCMYNLYFVNSRCVSMLHVCVCD